MLEVLERLIEGWESEVVEFKEANDNYSTDLIGKYFSALANEANLRNTTNAWLIFGVKNSTRSVVGTTYRDDIERLHSLKLQISEGSDPNATLRDIHVLPHQAGRVVIFEIPPAPRGVPIAWKGHHYSRAGESLVALPMGKLDEIRAQTINEDWSAAVVHEAAVKDLSLKAVERARKAFITKHGARFSEEEVISWPTLDFLNRLRVAQHGKLTRTALLLLGKPESAHFLTPNPTQITWKLVGQELAYEHFGPPFLLNTTAVFRRIRNVQLRLLPGDELLPHEVAKYDQNVVLEALHNCIAHQDYNLNGRVLVTEEPNRIIFESLGKFFDGKPDEYVDGTKTPLKYRNPYLVQAMVELNMIDQMGYGIRRMHELQRIRYLPMPDFDLSDSMKVKMTLHGGVVDSSYSRLLMENISIPLQEVLALDRVQKKLAVPDEMLATLRRKKLIEGRKPNIRVSSSVAAATLRKAEYIKHRAFDDQHYEELVLEMLRKFGRASRKEIDTLLWSKLSDALSETQKKNKIGNIISGLRRKGLLINVGPRTAPDWRLVDQR
ncbi:RNA-binding domain-containing protein [Sulfitobacter sp. 1A10445]|uniref:RNA-binding domain-containing protein n=1 Tax=unclassified Sulfitobacter TaxID=196795 RepID=UPI00374575B1